jgi:subtilisin family serine protease
MKSKIFTYLVIAGIALTMISLQIPQDEKFYYAFDEKVSLVAKKNTILVKYVEGIEQTIAIESLERLSNNFKIKWHGPLTAEISTGSQKSTEELAAKLKQDNEIYTCQPYYTLKNGLDMGVTDEILVRFLPEVTEEQQKELQKTLDVKVVKTTKIYQKLRVPKGGDALETANKYYESGWVEFATPNFISYAKLHQVIPNDTYFNRQIALHNTGQVFTDGHSGTNDADIDAPEAWGITTGCSDIVIAVIDEGVTPDHPDLPNTRQLRLSNSDFWSNDSDPSPNGNDNHGNACAGVIAATINKVF